MDRRVLFVNFTGLGNSVAVLGLFRSIESVRSKWVYFHTECPGLADAALVSRAGLKCFAGTVPATWRRFCAADWDDIVEFLHTNKIDTIINLRNEGPHRDRGYAEFKQMHAGSFEFFDLNSRHVNGAIADENLFALHLELIAEAGVEVRGHPGPWLAPRFGQARDWWELAEIGFFTAASQLVKTWMPEPWIELGTHVLERTPYSVAVFAGQGEKDVERAGFIARKLSERHSPRRVRVVSGLTTLGLAEALSQLSCLVSNDTSAVHLGAAVGVPTIGLYFATIGRIWGGLSSMFVPLQSGIGALCEHQKLGAGNCSYFYGGCPGPCRRGIDSELVYATIVDTLKIGQPAVTGELGLPASPPVLSD